jgi:hypothetical protein
MPKKNPAAVALGSMTSKRKKKTSAENGKKGGRHKKLWDVKLPAKVYCEVSDGSTFVTVDHLDGMYSYCITEKGAVVHLAGGAPLVKHKDGWRIKS